MCARVVAQMQAPGRCAQPAASRTVAVKSSRRRTRRSAGSTVSLGALRPRPTARRVPCGDAMTGSSGQHGCACAAGSRASSRADGCSAGTCACSRLLPPRVQGSSHAPTARSGNPRRARLPRYGRTRSQVKRYSRVGFQAIRCPSSRHAEDHGDSMWASGCSGGVSAVSVPAPAFPDRPFVRVMPSWRRRLGLA